MLLTRDELFELWAPATSPWSVWTKPLLFAHLEGAELRAVPPRVRVPAWAPPCDGTTIIVADLPGRRSVRAGERLAHAGFRPVPLFNAVPGPVQPIDELPIARSSVDVHSILAALFAATGRSGAVLRALPPDAPPIFLLDAARRHGAPPRPGDFDNRSVSLPSDFPSAAFLKSRGVARVLLLVASDPDFPATDLSHTLLRWQDGGIQLTSLVVDAALQGVELAPIRVQKPSWYRAMWHHALCTLGLRRNPLGGFGGTLPYPSAG